MSQKLIVGILGIGSFVLLAVGSWLYLNTDRTGPKITIPDEMITYSNEEDESILLEDVTAYDDVDLDVSSSLIVVSIIPLSDNEHAKIIYAARDSSNNITLKERTVLYQASTKLEVETDAEEAINTIDESNTDQTDTDESETDVSESDDVLGDNLEIDANGDINNLDTTPLVSNGVKPVIRLNKYKVNLEKGSTFDFILYVDDIVDDVDTRSALYHRIQLIDSPDMDIAGTYEVQYYVIDSDGNTSNIEILTVVVKP